jgi:hypothetical protein
MVGRKKIKLYNAKEWLKEKKLYLIRLLPIPYEFHWLRCCLCFLVKKRNDIINLFFNHNLMSFFFFSNFSL